MKFYNRKKEIELLSSLKKDFRVAIIGRRRIGKTTLVKKTFPNSIDLFISSEKTEKATINDWVSEHEKHKLPSLSSFKEFFEFLFTYKKEPIFIDELQNALKVNKSFFSDLQRLIDKHKPKLIVSGSYLSLMKNIIQEYKTPLYGRFDYIMNLNELDIKSTIQMCKDLGLNFKETLEVFFIFGGVPKYYELVEKTEFSNIKSFVERHFIDYPRPLFEEIRTMLKEEFGSEYKMYFSILQAISEGKNTLGEIANDTGKPQTNLTKYISTLEKDYEIIKRVKPLIKEKKGIYKIRNNIFDFWFSNVWRYVDYFENGQEEMIKGKLSLERHFGNRFEELILDNLNVFGLDFGKKGRQWGKFKGEEGKNVYEIDIISTNENNKKILFGECKWKDNVDAEKILEELKEKSQHIQFNKDKREEHYAIFAKSFKRKSKDAYNFDLEDIEKFLTGD